MHLFQLQCIIVCFRLQPAPCRILQITNIQAQVYDTALQEHRVD